MLKDTQNYSTEIFNSGIKKRFCLMPTQCIAVKHPMEKHAKNKERQVTSSSDRKN